MPGPQIGMQARMMKMVLAIRHFAFEDLGYFETPLGIETAR
ncbi:hypothetical protein [Sphingopyxis sp. KK2]|nr:hypothetical protein [Sphingopyxis sp. KK2]